VFISHVSTILWEITIFKTTSAMLIKAHVHRTIVQNNTPRVHWHLNSCEAVYYRHVGEAVQTVAQKY